MAVLDGLNEKQAEAVLETEGYVRVIAGAGSGKTKLLVSRYAYLVQDYGIDSANILCVTFTNKAAGEMKKRIRALIGPEHDTTLICTYHGFCNRLLRENPEKIFMTKQFQIIDEHQQKSILEEIYQKFELQLDYASYESILHKIARVKSSPDYVPAMCDPANCQILPQIRNQDDRIIEEFMQRQKAIYALDFHDLLSFALYLLQTDGEVRKKWQQRLNYIQVDEFQDSAGPEMKLVELLSAYYRNLMIVGDPDQNIYEWRGSDVKLLVDFDKGHEDTKTIILNQNYRSTPQILKCANTLIEKNKLRLKKDLFTHNPDGARVVHFHSKNDYAEMDTVIDKIKELQKNERYRYSDFAILYRSGFLSRIAEKKLVERNIPYEIFGGVKFYQRMEIQDVIAYLRLVAFDDDTALRRIINKPRRQFGQAKMNRLLELQDSNETLFGEKLSLFTNLTLGLEENLFQGSDMKSFVGLIEKMKENHPRMRISEIVNRVTADSGYEQYIRALGDEERLDNLAEFKRIANEFEKDFGENLTLPEFLQQLALQSGEDQQKEQDAVKLMTIHSSKGLEFPVVFILGFSEGVFPSAKTIEGRKNLGLEEERRLCYVAITRAKEYLFLLDSEGPSQNGSRKLLSRFLEEIGEENYVRVGNISEELKKESRAYAAKIGFLYEEEAVERHIGDEVEHHIFGKGKILSIDEKRGSYQIKFDHTPLPRTISRNYFNKPHEKAKIVLEETKGRADAGEWNIPEKAAEPEDNEPEDKLEGGKDSVMSGDVLFDEKETAFYEGASAESAEMPADCVEASAESVETSVESAETSVESAEMPAESGEAGERKGKLDELRKNSENLWKREDVPHSGWECEGVSDLGEPVGICEMCGYQIIRYAHHMYHKDYGHLTAGCVCAGKMEGDVEAAKKRESDFKNRQSRQTHFYLKKWKKSHKGNEYLKIDGHIIVLYRIADSGKWKYSIDNEFGTVIYPSRDKVLEAVFEKLEKLKTGNR